MRRSNQAGTAAPTGDRIAYSWLERASAGTLADMTTVTMPPAAAAATDVQKGPFASPVGPPGQPVRALGQRVASMDAYRGMVMLLMMGEVLSFGDVAKAK